MYFLTTFLEALQSMIFHCWPYITKGIMFSRFKWSLITSLVRIISCIKKTRNDQGTLIRVLSRGIPKFLSRIEFHSF